MDGGGVCQWVTLMMMVVLWMQRIRGTRSSDQDIPL